jgi:hypothetical protein
MRLPAQAKKLQKGAPFRSSPPLNRILAGKIADVQVWNGTALSSAQAAAFSG